MARDVKQGQRSVDVMRGEVVGSYTKPAHDWETGWKARSGTDWGRRLRPWARYPCILLHSPPLDAWVLRTYNVVCCTYPDKRIARGESQDSCRRTAGSSTI